MKNPLLSVSGVLLMMCLLCGCTVNVDSINEEKNNQPVNTEKKVESGAVSFPATFYDTYKNVIYEIELELPEDLDVTKIKKGEVIRTASSNTEKALEVFAEKDSENLLEENTYGIDLFMTNITNKGATVICSQSGGYPTGVLQTGSWYAVETVNKDGVWEELNWKNDNIAWTEEAYMIAKDNVLKLEVNWSYLYGELSPGKYRLVKEIMDFRGPVDYDTKLHYAEFEIK